VFCFKIFKAEHVFILSFSHFIFNFAEQLPSRRRSTAMPSSIMDDNLQAIVKTS